MVALDTTRAFGYDGIGDLWTGIVLQRGLLFQRKSDNGYFISLGFREYVCLGWKLEVVPLADSQTYFKSSIDFEWTALSNLQFMINTRLSGLQRTDKNEDFAGIPYPVCRLVFK